MELLEDSTFATFRGEVNLAGAQSAQPFRRAREWARKRGRTRIKASTAMNNVCTSALTGNREGCAPPECRCNWFRGRRAGCRRAARCGAAAWRKAAWARHPRAQIRQSRNRAGPHEWRLPVANEKMASGLRSRQAPPRWRCRDDAFEVFALTEAIDQALQAFVWQWTIKQRLDIFLEALGKDFRRGATGHCAECVFGCAPDKRRRAETPRRR